jgi:hypothetical protein
VEQLKICPTIGVCGLDCGLCPRYYTRGTSRCPGCGGPAFSEKHPTCSFITCCVKRRGLEVCGECTEFPCSKFKSEEEYRQTELSSSYPPSSKMLSNLRSIKDNGIREFVKRQQKRIGLLETMIGGYDDGRSRSLFCRAAALLDPAALECSLGEATRRIKAGGLQPGDAGSKARTLKAILTETAVEQGIELTKKR